MKVSIDLWQRHEFGVASVTVPVCAGGQNNKRGTSFQNPLCRRKKGIISFEQNL